MEPSDLDASTRIGDGSTLTRVEQERRRGSGLPVSLPALTIIYHPDLRRVGERAVLSELASGLGAELGRQQPRFSPPGKRAAAPLGDRALSRQPFVLRAVAGGLELDPTGTRTRLRVDGRRVTGSVQLSPRELAHGVVLELARRVVLLLHSHTPSAEEPVAFDLVGASDGIVRVRGDVERVSDLQVPVLMRGATGTGKELVAAAIHRAGPRRERPFIAVNLGALSPSLAAAELFGAVKGAFTGATRSSEGYFRRADGGTLFLDEVGEAPPELQVMLLRVLETGEIFPVGSSTPRRVDVRLLAATDADLEAMAEAGGFKAPLLHRLAGYEIWLPTLAQRRDDFGRLFFHFLRQELQELGESDRLEAPDATSWLPADLVARLARHDWPGNVRQLRNAVRQLVIGGRGRATLTLDERLERQLASAETSPSHPPEPFAAAAPTPTSAPAPPPARRKPSEVSTDELVATLRAQRWDISAAAEALAISRASLYVLIERTAEVRTAGDLEAAEIRRAHATVRGDLDAMVDLLEVSKPALRRRVKELGLD
ncbi:MAG: sigma 54-interacting transcriptional regulator [Acidobacteriota bacterium]